MKKQTWGILLLVIVLTISLPACSKSASGALAATPTATNSVPFATPLPSSAMSVILAGTQTAQALTNPNATSLVAVSMTPAATNAEGATQAVAATTGNIPASTTVATAAAPTATKIVVPTATPGKPSSYTLQAGEYPYCIARRFNVNVADLLNVNGLTSDSRPAAGTVLNIPQTGIWSSGARALKSHPTTYTVSASTETIYSVACGFGDVDPNAIIITNSLQSPYTLTAGQTLDIP